MYQIFKIHKVPFLLRSFSFKISHEVNHLNQSQNTISWYILSGIYQKCPHTESYGLKLFSTVNFDQVSPLIILSIQPNLHAAPFLVSPQPLHAGHALPPHHPVAFLKTQSVPCFTTIILP